MINLQTQIENLNQQDWDYYYAIEPNYFPNPFCDYITHEEFIKKYFKHGGKEGIFRRYFYVASSYLNHSAHTNSIFFLGILICKNTKIENLYNFQNNLPGYSLFPFLWFLTCLFHDMGYDYEERFDIVSKIWDIDSLKKEFRIDYDFIKQPIHRIPESILKNISKYFIWKRYKLNKIDHGIVAGYYLYDKLVKNRKKKYLKSHDDRFWHPMLDAQYAEAASAIASHNIWFATPENRLSYKCFYLEQLIDHPPISISESPLLFLLGLVDSIDPVKIFKNDHKIEYILNNINFTFSIDSIKIENLNIDKIAFSKLVRKCESLKNWLKVKITINDNSVYIVFD